MKQTYLVWKQECIQEIWNLVKGRLFTVFSGTVIAVIQKYVMNSENWWILKHFLSDTHQASNRHFVFITI